MIIKTVIRLRNDLVMVFDIDGEQVPEYQGQYEDVKERILRSSSPTMVFDHWFSYSLEPEVVLRKNW